MLSESFFRYWLLVNAFTGEHMDGRNFRITIVRSAQDLFVSTFLCILKLLAEFSNCFLSMKVFNYSDVPSFTVSCPLHALECYSMYHQRGPRKLH